jgi:hypothetical protein
MLRQTHRLSQVCRRYWRYWFHPEAPIRLDGPVITLSMMAGYSFDQALIARSEQNIARNAAWKRGERI